MSRLEVQLHDGPHFISDDLEIDPESVVDQLNEAWKQDNLINFPLGNGWLAVPVENIKYMWVRYE